MIFRLERCGMKFGHIGDLHIGKRVHDFSMLEDQRYILDQMMKIFEEQKVDGVLIAGDVYDKTVPSAEAVQLFDEFITGLAKAEIPVYMISGNHDSAERLSFGGKLFESSDIYISQVYDGEMKRIVLKDQYGPISVYLLPFLKPAAVRHALQRDDINTYEEGVMAALQECEIDRTQRNVLVAHQFVAGAASCESEEPSVGGIDWVDAALFDKFDYVALGHLHSPQKVGRDTLRYCGTPLKYYEGTAVDDYLHITLTDEQDIPEALARLRVIYPNLMRLDYDNRRTQTRQELDAPAKAEQKTPLDHFADFYQLQNNQPLTHEQAAFCQQLIESIWKEEDA